MSLFTISPGSTLSNRGTIDSSSGELLIRENSISRTYLIQENLVSYGVPLSDARVWDAPGSSLPAAAATDDLGLDPGTWGTDGLIIKSSDAKATTITQYFRQCIVLPAEYVAAQTVQVSVTGGMITTISDDTATLDLECYVGGSDGAVGSDLCATAASSINALLSGTPTTIDFTITSTSLVPGDILDCRFKVAITDAATGTAVIGALTHLTRKCDIKG